MKPSRCPQGQLSLTVPELIQHLRRLSSRMEVDPALSEAAKHIKRAVTDLENARRAAFEVYQESLAASAGRRADRPYSSDEQDDDAAEWLRNLQAASPLKQ